jgi:hypothetical protein
VTVVAVGPQERLPTQAGRSDAWPTDRQDGSPSFGADEINREAAAPVRKVLEGAMRSECLLGAAGRPAPLAILRVLPAGPLRA